MVGSLAPRAAVALLALLLSLALASNAFAAGDPSSKINLDHMGCDRQAGETLPNAQGDFICQQYANGNLGKTWSELDLVPFRLTASNGGESAETFSIALAGDYKSGGATGWDVLSALSVAASQPAGCAVVTSGPQTITGDESLIYRVVTITVPSGASCEFDYYFRLALGAHLFPGSSLHSYVKQQSLESLGNQTRQLPVKQILPQQLSKTMTAKQDQDVSWGITKTAPANVEFPDTCTAATRSAQAQITVEWQKFAPQPDGTIAVTTAITATNPASRQITVDITDQIRSGSTVLDAFNTGDEVIPANTQKGFLHNAVVPGDSTDLNDIAAATYKDLVTGVPVPGTSQAVASAPVQSSGSVANNSARITDVEHITGAGLSYSVDAVTDNTGAFTTGGFAPIGLAYPVPGPQTTADVYWKSGVKGESGSVTFTKTIRVAGAQSTTGALSDVATVTGSDGFAASDAASIGISATACSRLTIKKVTVPASDATSSFGFTSGDVAEFNASLENGQSVAKDLVPGTYSAAEAADQPGWRLTGIACKDDATQATVPHGATARTAAVALAAGQHVTCTFTNTQDGEVLVRKTEAGDAPARQWKFTLDGPDGYHAEGATDASGELGFRHLVPGEYTLCEVDLPADWHSSLEQVDGAVVSAGKVCVKLTIGAGEEEVVDVDNVEAKIALDKTVRRLGGSFAKHADAHVGDTVEYRFEVTNPGVGALTVILEDLAPICADDPALQSGDSDGDGKLDPGETWDYRCSHLVTEQDADPLPNTAKVTGTDRYGNEATDRSSAVVDVLHPDIAVAKRVRVFGAGEFVDAGLKAHVGDELEYRFVVTAGDSDTPIEDVQLTDPRCDEGTLQGPDKTGDDALDPGETWTYTCTHVITDADPNPLPNTATATGHDRLDRDVSGEDSTSVDILKPGALVVKEGNQLAYPGDTVTFTFAVTNNGNTPLGEVTVTDDHCSPVTGPTEKRDDNGDDLLDPGEEWIFTCAKLIPADHEIGDENPIRNVAIATGRDELGKTVTAQDDHLVRVLHPAIDIEKTGPASAVVGTALAYTLTVTNPGDAPFAAQEVGVTDPRCEAPPAGPSTGGDATPGHLDPGDTWAYTCTAQTTGQPAGSFVNTATVSAKDLNGRTVTDADDFTTVLEAQAVLAEKIVSGTARLRGPSGCVHKAFAVTVRGSRIARVTFFRDGKRIKRIVAEPGQRRFTLRIAPSQRQGVHRITAKVRFVAASQTRTRTLRLSYQRCRSQVVRPRFTG